MMTHAISSYQKTAWAACVTGLCASDAHGANISRSKKAEHVRSGGPARAMNLGQRLGSKTTGRCARRGADGRRCRGGMPCLRRASGALSLARRRGGGCGGDSVSHHLVFFHRLTPKHRTFRACLTPYRELYSAAHTLNSGWPISSPMFSCFCHWAVTRK
jgi:hypothetical protein